MQWFGTRGGIVKPSASSFRLIVDYASLPGPPGVFWAALGVLCILSPSLGRMSLFGPTVLTSSLSFLLFWPQLLEELEAAGRRSPASLQHALSVEQAPCAVAPRPCSRSREGKRRRRRKRRGSRSSTFCPTASSIGCLWKTTLHTPILPISGWMGAASSMTSVLPCWRRKERSSSRTRRFSLFLVWMCVF